MIRCHRIDPGSIPGQSISFTFFCSLADRLFIICSHVLLRGRGRKKDSPMARLELATFWLICVRVRRSKPIEPHGTCLSDRFRQHIFTVIKSSSQFSLLYTSFLVIRSYSISALIKCIFFYQIVVRNLDLTISNCCFWCNLVASLNA